MPAVLLSVLVIVLIAVVALWLIKQIPLPSGLEIIRTILVVIVVVIALTKLLNLW